jgi:DNA-binding transcriptional LysR family regulator
MSSNIVDLRKLRAVQLIARRQSMKDAAAELRLSVPAVSLQIRSLEQELGTQLFRRIGKKMVTTPAGDAFLAEAEKIIDVVDHAFDSISRKVHPTSSISLSIGNDLAKRFSTAIAQFLRENRDVEISIRIKRSFETLALVMNGEVDLGVGYFEDVPREITRRPFRESGLSLVVPPDHPFLKRRRPSLQEIAQQRLIILRHESDMGKRVWRAFTAAGVEPTSIIEAGNCQTSREFAEKGIGVAVTHTACLGQNDLQTLGVIDVSRYFGTVDIAAIYRDTRRFLPVHHKLLELLAAVRPS